MQHGREGAANFWRRRISTKMMAAKERQYSFSGGWVGCRTVAKEHRTLGEDNDHEVSFPIQGSLHNLEKGDGDSKSGKGLVVHGHLDIRKAIIASQS
jgi:hypothetical protein